jgi:hypothetical protein
MNSIFKIMAITALTVCGLLVINVATNATTILPLNCSCQARAGDGCRTCNSGASGKKCRNCGKLCRPRKCPTPECDVCLLELDCGKEKKTCFKTEQKLICVPPVRLPWKKCCPPGVSKTKTITVLKTHSYECPSCSYKWTVQEPAIAESSTTPSEPTEAKPDEQESIEPESTPEKAIPPQPPFEEEAPKVSIRF